MFLENLFLVARPFAGTKKINFCLLQDAQTAAILSGYACNVTDILMAFNEKYLSLPLLKKYQQPAVGVEFSKTKLKFSYL